MWHKTWWGVNFFLTARVSSIPPQLTGGEIKTEKALLARKMSPKAAAKHLMGFIYLQPPSDLGVILRVDVLFSVRHSSGI